MTKYIVKNCPAYGVTTPISCALTSDDSCEFTDCPTKQIIELVKGGNPFLTEKVLEILQVEEVNND